MSGLSPAEIITTSFYAWEVRGRGWQVADYPVCLEPPFRHCFVLPDLVAETKPIDDGKRPTFLSSVVEGLRSAFALDATPAPEPAPPYEEPAPYPALASGPLTAFCVTVPMDHKSHPETTIRLLVALSTCCFPVSLELIGCEGQVIIQLVCADTDQAHVAAQCLAYLPDAAVIETEDLLASVWDRRREHAVVDFGLSQEFFLPFDGLKSQKLDPYLSLVPSLARADRDEAILLQVLFQGVQNPWGKAIRDALDDGQGGSVFADAPAFPRLADEKLKTSLFAVSVRVAAQAQEAERAWHLARSTGAFFLQLGRPGANELLPLENDGYREDLHVEAILTRQSYRLGMILSADELAALAHLPDAAVRHPSLTREERRTKPLPVEASGHPHVLGENQHRGKMSVASLSDGQRLQHTWIVGASGTGKSTLLLNLITEDIRLGHGVAVLDPHGDLIDDILARVPDSRTSDVIVFDPSDTEWPIGFNIFSAGSEGERALLAADLVGIFRRFSTSWGDTMSAVLGNAVLAILEHPQGGTLLDLRRLLVDERFRRAYLEDVADEEVAFFWSREYPVIGSRSIGPILTRLDTFLRPKVIRHIVGQPDGKLHFSDVMASKRIFLAKLSHGLIGEENAYLLGSLIVGKFLGLALARQQLAKDERAAFFLYADEFQHFLTPSMETLLTAARKYALGATLAHQTMAQLRDSPKVEGALLGNAYTRIVFRTGESDARQLAEGFSFFEGRDIHGLGRGEAIARLGSSGNDFNLKTLPLPGVPPGAEERRSQIIFRSRERYGTPIEALRALLGARYRASEEPAEAKPRPPLEEAPPALSGAGEPIAASCETPRASVPEPKTGEQLMARRVPINVAAVTPGRGGQEHKYLQHLVKRLAEERGFRATIEEAAGDGRADVVLSKSTQRIACEISVTTDHIHEEENLRKCLAAGFEQIVFVVPDRKRREKLKGHFQEIAGIDSLAVISTEEIVAYLDGLDTGSAVAESTVRGYKVKVTRQTVSPEELAGRRSAIAEVIARSLLKHKDV